MLSWLHFSWATLYVYLTYLLYSGQKYIRVWVRVCVFTK